MLDRVVGKEAGREGEEDEVYLFYLFCLTYIPHSPTQLWSLSGLQ